MFYAIDERMQGEGCHGGKETDEETEYQCELPVADMCFTPRYDSLNHDTIVV